MHCPLWFLFFNLILIDSMCMHVCLIIAMWNVCLTSVLTKFGIYREVCMIVQCVRLLNDLFVLSVWAVDIQRICLSTCPK